MQNDLQNGDLKGLCHRQTMSNALESQQYKTTGCSQGHAKNSRWRTACLAMEEMHTTYGSLRSCFLRRLKVLVWDGDEIQIDSVSEKMCPLKTPMKFKHCPAKSPIIQEGRTCSRRGHHQWGLRWFALSDSFAQVGHLVLSMTGITLVNSRDMWCSWGQAI